MNNKSLILLAGTGSGCGKTTIALGIMSALCARGIKTLPCKVGPDYLDSSWHSVVTGTPSRNLDAYMLPKPILNALFHQYIDDFQVAVIEGVMGLYDGLGSDPHYCSTAAMAKQLKCSVILLVDGKAVSTTLAAIVMGMLKFDPTLTIAGVLLNRVNSESHFRLLKHAIEHYCHVPVIGYIPVMKDITLPSRHLGLVPPSEQGKDTACWQQLAQQIEKTVDVTRLLTLSAWRSHSDIQPVNLTAHTHGRGLTVAVAYDAAFNFYYPDNLDLLRQTGATVVTFSPLTDSCLPESCNLIYIGGGYPEIHASQLSANHTMRESIKAAHLRGIPIYAECGGLMYLGETLTDSDKACFPMVGIIRGHSTMTQSLKRFGYCEATALMDTTLIKAGESLRGHEFHYSDFKTDLPAALTFFKQRNGLTEKCWQGGYQVGNTFASYLHVHFAQRPDLLNHWLTQARECLDCDVNSLV